MNHLLKIALKKCDFVFAPLVKLCYPKYKRRSTYKLNIKILYEYAIMQKLVGFNRFVPWPVHFTSKVLNYKNISKGRDCDPGDSAGNYIQAYNGIIFGSFIEIGPGVKIISANHNSHDLSAHDKAAPIQIGSNVWIGANAVILPGVNIGKNTIIGAGSIVTKDIPSDCIAAGNPCKVLRKKSEVV